MVSPKEHAVEIYYLEENEYEPVVSYIFVESAQDENYNADTVLALRCLPAVTVILEEILEGIN